MAINNKPCGMESCTLAFTAQGETAEREFCSHPNSMWVVQPFNETLTIQPTKILNVQTRNLATVYIQEGKGKEIIAKLRGTYNAPDETKLPFVSRPFTLSTANGGRSGISLELGTGISICPGFDGDLTLDLEIPQNHAFEYLSVNGKTVTSECPKLTAIQLNISAEGDILCDMQTLNLIATTLRGNITGSMVSIGTTYVRLQTTLGNIDLMLKDFDQLYANVCSQSTDIPDYLLAGGAPSERRLLGSIRADFGSITIR